MSTVDALLKGIRDQQLSIMESFVNNPCADMSAYERRVGEFLGLKKAEEQILYLVTPKNDADDDRK